MRAGLPMGADSAGSRSAATSILGPASRSARTKPPSRTPNVQPRTSSPPETTPPAPGHCRRPLTIFWAGPSTFLGIPPFCLQKCLCPLTAQQLSVSILWASETRTLPGGGNQGRPCPKGSLTGDTHSSRRHPRHRDLTRTVSKISSKKRTTKKVHIPKDEGSLS